MIDYQYFQKSLNHLQAQFLNYQSLDPALPKLMQEAVAESVIQRFEVCYDCLWKVLKRYLVEVLGIPEVPKRALIPYTITAAKKPKRVCR
ncbi:MAG: nucleotidyltransferase substrate binding protein [Nitrosomonas sp.]|uniref:nucleotidyltransferase substrate binding protein n=1 Tax=Nitrosomonas sp. TaxID=42353 RepID=UPI001D74F79F|nr:nucleotidyltransferase substrate binding protein [Nitrosomonas sp.]MBX9893637.1 nucleotidyltransferase substrate binding protein [Nitrosomonas sp.]